MIDGYFLRGVTGDNLLVFRTDDPEEIFRIIKRLCATRDKDLKALAERLEREWFEQYRGSNSGSGPNNKKKTKDGTRNRVKKNADPKPRT